MSEFKFACPICGQHITADSKDTGSQIACPTCFRKIVVPTAPSTEESKFVVSASEVNKPRPKTNPELEGFQPAPKNPAFPLGLLLLFVIVLAAGATVFVLHGKHPKSPGEKTADAKTGSRTVTTFTHYSGPSHWTLELTNVTIPEDMASGAIHGMAFTVEHATISGGNLTLRMGHSGPVELGLNIYFFSKQPEELIGKSAQVTPADSRAPRVVLHWTEGQRESTTFHNGYAMKIQFGAKLGNAIPGEIFISTPDESKSWIAGTFRAEIHHPGPPKRRPTAVEHQTQ